MPQGQKRQNDFSDFNQVVGRPARADDFSDFNQVIAGAGDFSDFNQVIGQPQESTYERLRRQLGLGLEITGQKVADMIAAGAEIAGGIATGDFRPAREAAEIAGRTALTLASAFDPVNAEATYPAVAAEQGRAIQGVEQQRVQRREASGDIYFRGSAIENARLAAEAAKDPSLLGTIVRGAPQTLPYIATGILSGGSIPALAATGAALELNTPENIPLAAGLAAAPIPVGQAARAGFNAVRRVLGRGVEQIAEAEARSGAGALIRATGASVDQDAIRAASPPSSGLNAAIAEAVAEVPQSTAKRVFSEVSAFPRAMMSSLDISAPGRQGLLLSVAPSRWGASVKAGGRMFQAFKPKHYERITKEIASHADAGAADDAGLYLAFRTPEEFFTSRLASKVPGVQASQRAYETYLDSLRMSTFSQYKRLIDKTGLSPDDATKAYKAAAQWINYATGRGSLGKNFDKAVPLLSQFLFAPRYAASRFNVLNPVMYYRNFKDPATRVVGKEQMKDLAQYLGAVATTFGLAKAAGLDVGLNPNKGDFLKIRWGAKTYDPGAGLIQVMRFAIRASNDLFRASKGEKAEWGQDAGSLALKFIRSKVAPVPSYAWDFFSRRTYEGKDFTPGQAALGVVERVTPLTWSDFTEALLTEGIGSAAATLPGAVGIGVQSYSEPGGALDRMQPLLSEFVRLDRSVPEIRRAQNESEADYGARVKVFGEALERFGLELVNSDQYRKADDATKRKALDLLPRRISGALIKQGEAWMLAPRILIDDVRENQQIRREKK